MNNPFLSQSFNNEDNKNTRKSGLNQSTISFGKNRLTTYKKLEYSKRKDSVRSVNNFRESLYETNKVENHGFFTEPFKELPNNNIDMNASAMLSQSILYNKLNNSVNNNNNITTQAPLAQLDIIEENDDVENPMNNLLGGFYITISMFIYSLVLLIQKEVAVSYPEISYDQQNIYKGLVLVVLNYYLQIKSGAPFYFKGEYEANKILFIRMVNGSLGEFFLLLSSFYLRINTASIFTIITAVVCSYVAAIVLKEKVNSMDSSIIICSFMASCLIIKPFFGSGEDTFFGLVLGVLSVVVNCIAIIYHKFLDPRVTNFLVNYYTGMFFLIEGLIFFLINSDDKLALGVKQLSSQIVLSVLYALCRYYNVKGLSIGKVSFVLTFENTFIVFSMVFGYFILGESCDLLDIIGSALLISLSVARSVLIMRDDEKIIEEVNKDINETSQIIIPRELSSDYNNNAGNSNKGDARDKI